MKIYNNLKKKCYKQPRSTLSLILKFEFILIS